jgi:hypothetical protein
MTESSASNVEAVTDTAVATTEVPMYHVMTHIIRNGETQFSQVSFLVPPRVRLPDPVPELEETLYTDEDYRACNIVCSVVRYVSRYFLNPHKTPFYVVPSHTDEPRNSITIDDIIKYVVMSHGDTEPQNLSPNLERLLMSPNNRRVLDGTISLIKKTLCRPIILQLFKENKRLFLYNYLNEYSMNEYYIEYEMNYYKVVSLVCHIGNDIDKRIKLCDMLMRWRAAK